MGEISQALGHLDKAEGAYRESLTIRRRLLEGIGETPETLRDLSVSLTYMGDISRALGHLEDAEGAYRESLEIDRKVLERFGETPEALEDLSLSLGNMGKISQALGHLEEAEVAYNEALEKLDRLNQISLDKKLYEALTTTIKKSLDELKDSHSNS
jgi:tetratricopeptide (TPR) repeat protein